MLMLKEIEEQINELNRVEINFLELFLSDKLWKFAQSAFCELSNLEIWFRKVSCQFSSQMRKAANEQQQDITCIEENVNNKSTSQQTKYFLNKFVDFLKNMKLPYISTKPVRYLQSYLRLWFVKCRKEDGNIYSTCMYCCMRDAIHRSLSESLLPSIELTRQHCKHHS